ncbi:MAG: TRAP transporter substrate-binding protein DctP [Burkholderiaceae bacterium]
MSHANTPSSRRTLLKGTLAVAAAPAIITSASAQEKVTWRLQAHYPKASTSFSGNVAVMAEEVKARTDGRFTIEALGAGEIAKGREIFNIVRRGVTEMGTANPGYNLGESELMGLFVGVPGTLRNSWEQMHFTKNLGLENALNETLRPKGLIMKAAMALPNELVLKEKITADTNLSSIKVRSSGNIVDYLESAGFAPQQIAGPELYQALATGVVDGAHWGGTQGALSMKLWEVAPIHMMPSLLISNDTYMINVKAYDELPDDLRRILTSVLEERYLGYSIGYNHREAIALTTGIEKMGVEVQQFPDEIMARFAEASKSLLEREIAKGPLAKEYGETLSGLMRDLGYI